MRGVPYSLLPTDPPLVLSLLPVLLNDTWRLHGDRRKRACAVATD